MQQQQQTLHTIGFEATVALKLKRSKTRKCSTHRAKTFEPERKREKCYKNNTKLESDSKTKVNNKLNGRTHKRQRGKKGDRINEQVENKKEKSIIMPANRVY